MQPTSEPISSRKLVYAALIALLAALLLLVTIILPAEFGIDPTGVGQALGLKQLGDGKQIAHVPTDATAVQPDGADAANSASTATANAVTTEPTVTESATTPVDAALKQDEHTITLQPGEGVEYKAAMRTGQSMRYHWATEQGELYFDFHGDAENAKNGEFTSYKEATLSTDSGDFTAGFNGVHGWYWKNRSSQVITVRLKTEGNYASLGRVH